MRRVVVGLAAPVLAVAVAVAVSLVVLLATGNSPGRVFGAMAVRGLQTETVVSTLNRTGPYYLSAVAVAVGFKMNLFNIGVEGQYRLAALLAAAAGAAVALPAPLHVLLILAVAMAVGAAWASVAGILRATRGVSEVIATIMLNAIAGGVAALLLDGYLAAPRAGYTVGTRPLPRSGRLGSLNGLVAHLGIHLPPAVRLQAYLFVAVAAGVGYHLLVWRTRFGFDLRAAGANRSAAEAGGVDVRRMIVATMAVSGALAGLVGLSQVLSEAGRYTSDTVVSGLGFTGIAVALLGRNHPVGIGFAALLWAFMDAVQTPLADEGLPKQITAIMQGVIVLSVVIAYEVVRRAAARAEASTARRSVDGPSPAAA